MILWNLQSSERDSHYSKNSAPKKVKLKQISFKEVHSAILEGIDIVLEVRKLLGSQECFLEANLVEL